MLNFLAVGSAVLQLLHAYLEQAKRFQGLSAELPGRLKMSASDCLFVRNDFSVRVLRLEFIGQAGWDL